MPSEHWTHVTRQLSSAHRLYTSGLRARWSPLAETTKDSDIAVDPRSLQDHPLIEEAMRAGLFVPNLESPQPGSWVNAEGVPVDLMVPEQLAGPGGKKTRGARIPPHDPHATRRARGLEAAMVDNDVMEIRALDPVDARRLNARVAGSAALVIAKLHKIGDRVAEPRRLVDKDAHDVYRLLVATDTEALAAKFWVLLRDELCGQVTAAARVLLGDLFASGPDAVGSTMAGRAEEGIGEPETVALQVAILTDDLLKAIDRQG